jgi:ribosome-binding protein aMBF1 (putative translation factor)
MTSEIDPKKAPSLITKDWTTNDNKSEPFYLQPETKTINEKQLQLKERYAITVVTKYKSTGKTREELSARMSEQKQVALDRILKHYDKFTENKEEIDVIPEGWDINERPNSRLKVLLSVPVEQIDSNNWSSKSSF